MASSEESETDEQEPVIKDDSDVLQRDENGKPVLTLEGGKNLPPQFKNFKRQVGSKKQQRVQYEYRYSNDPDN